MDLDTYLSDDVDDDVNVSKKDRRKNNLVFKRGRFTREEDDFIAANYDSMTDAQIAKALGRSRKSIEHARTRLELTKTAGRPSVYKKGRNLYLASLDDDQKRSFFLKELKASALYKALQDTFNDIEQGEKYVSFYEQKYIDFMSDPTIETVTQPERDLLHEVTMAQIRIFKLLRKENDPVMVQRNGEMREINRDFSREIVQCQEIIRKNMESLNVTRSQRLKNRNDQAVNFTEVIKELRHPDIRRKVGDQAAMFNYITLRHYNDQIGRGIKTGNPEKFDVNALFKKGKEPEELDGDFTGKKMLAEEKTRERGLVATTGSQEKNKRDNGLS